MKLNIITRDGPMALLKRLYPKRLPTSPYLLSLCETVTFLFWGVRRDLLARLAINSTTKNGTIDGKDFY
jgi:hypothetical protein